jgi:hypothetical protein
MSVHDVSIWTYTVGWNEEINIQLYIAHYTQFANKLIIYDNESTDRMIEIAQLCRKVEIRKQEATHGLNDREKSNLLGSAWEEVKQLKTSVDFVVVGDIDELAFLGNMKELAKKEPLANVWKCDFWNPVKIYSAPFDPVIALYKQGAYGFFSGQKPLIFKPVFEKLQIDPGQHVWLNPPGANITINEAKTTVSLMHLDSFWGEERKVYKYKRAFARLSALNKERKHGVHYATNAGEVRSTHRMQVETLKIIPLY